MGQMEIEKKMGIYPLNIKKWYFNNNIQKVHAYMY